MLKLDVGDSIYEFYAGDQVLYVCFTDGMKREGTIMQADELALIIQWQDGEFTKETITRASSEIVSDTTSGIYIFSKAPWRQ